MHLLEVFCLFCNTTTVSMALPIRDANNITPTTISATSTPVDSTGAGHDDWTSEIDAMDVSIIEGEC